MKIQSRSKISCFLLVAFLASLMSPLAGQTRPPRPRASNLGGSVPSIPEERVARTQPTLDAFVLNEMKRQNAVGVALGTVIDGKIDYLKGYGYQDRQAKIPVSARKTMFRWASISKTLTGIVAVKQAGAGKIDLDRPISDYLTDYQVPSTYTVRCKGGEKEIAGKTYKCRAGFAAVPLDENQRLITTRQLLGHLAGVMHYRNGKGSPQPPFGAADDPSINKGFAWATQYFVKKPLVAVPGDRMSYTTFGFNLAGTVLEAAGGRPFAALVAERISKPLDMKSLQPDYEWAEIANRAVGYNLEHGKIVRQGSNDVSWKLPGGGFISTAQDLAGFCRGLMGDSFLSPQEKKQLWTPQKLASGKDTTYGLGFGVRDYRGHREVGHGGSQQKARTHLRLLPDDGLCVVVMSNSNNINPLEITGGVMKILLRRKQSGR